MDTVRLRRSRRARGNGTVYALGGIAEIEEHFQSFTPSLTHLFFAYDIPVCVHTKLPWKLLARLGAEGVLAGVKDSSGDDASFRYLVQENEKNGHPMALLTGHEIMVDGRFSPGRMDPFRACKR